jgi:hypothetical protein
MSLRPAWATQSVSLKILYNYKFYHRERAGFHEAKEIYFISLSVKSLRRHAILPRISKLSRVAGRTFKWAEEGGIHEKALW